MKKFVKILVLILFSICLGAGICTHDFFGSGGWFCAIIWAFMYLMEISGEEKN